MATIEIVGAAEVAEILGIGNTNFSHLRKQRAGTCLLYTSDAADD